MIYLPVYEKFAKRRFSSSHCAAKQAQLSKYAAPTDAAYRLSRITVRLMTATVRGRLI
jgi:hypothetical protein